MAEQYNIYDSLNAVRTTLLNAVTAKRYGLYDTPTRYKLNTLLQSITDDIDEYEDLISEIENLDEVDLIDLGFGYIDDDDHPRFYLYPIWVYPIIPDGEELFTYNDETIIKGIDGIPLYNDSWLAVGFSK